MQDYQLSKTKGKQEEYVEALKKGGVVSGKWWFVIFGQFPSPILLAAVVHSTYGSCSSSCAVACYFK
jgi:hypothetical protein